LFCCPFEMLMGIFPRLLHPQWRSLRVRLGGMACRLIKLTCALGMWKYLVDTPR
jgi:hypothetical protein